MLNNIIKILIVLILSTVLLYACVLPFSLGYISAYEKNSQKVLTIKK